MSPFHRTIRLRVAILVIAVLVMLLAIPVQAAPALRSTNTLFDATTQEPVPGSASSLVRTSNGLSMNLRTSGLERNHTYTIWWIIFNDPGDCDTNPDGPIKCGPEDLLLFDGDAGIVGYATGNVTGGSGKSGFAAHLSTEDTSGFIDSFFEHNGLTNPLGAEVHLVVRDHGPKVSSLMPDQIHTFAGGCDQSDLPEPLRLGVPGTYDCSDVQFTVHVAP